MKQMLQTSFAVGLLIVAVYTFSTTATAETVIVKYRGPVELSHFDCQYVSRSSVVKRLCYDSHERYVVVNLTGTYYHYCEVPPTTVTAWKQAPSMGTFYNSEIKGRFDCRNSQVPAYDK
jgi:hypothetical protein